MPILNSDTFFYLDTDSKVSREDTILWHMRDFSATDCYYFEFKNDSAFEVFPIETLIPAHDLIRLKNKEIQLVLCNSHEAFHSVVDGIYRSLVLGNNIPPEQIVLMSESHDILTEVKKVSAQYGLAEIKVEWVRVFENSVHRDTLHLIQTAPRRPVVTDRVYTKKFLNFNRRWRLHRPALVALLYAYGILDKGHVSLGMSDDNKNWDSVWPSLRQMFAGDQHIDSLFATHEQSIVNLQPLYLDSTDLITNKAILEHTTTELYEDTYFSVVTETNFFTQPTYGSYLETGRFLSEKTFKPIAKCHPFIVVSVPNFLDSVREIGYKTFSPWIDESYDTELDDAKRLAKIVAEIKRLSELTPDEIEQFMSGVHDICTFNLGVLLRKTEFITVLN